MEEIDGARQGSRRYFHEGYVYHLDIRVASADTYRCAHRISLQCQGQARVERNRVSVTRPHNAHPPNPFIVSEARMRLELVRLSRETMRSFTDIYREVAFRYEQPVVEVVTLRSMRTSMDRERHRVIPNVPQHMVALGDFLREFPTTQPIYRGNAIGTDGICALLFATDSMIERLNHMAEIFMSCCFRINAGPTRTYRMVILYARAGETAIPIVYVLLEGISKPQFLAVWQLLLRLSPGLEHNLRSAICAYESSIIGSVRETFPQITIAGSWFFYCMWVQLRLATSPQTVLWMAASLPLAPVARFGEGLECIVSAADNAANEHPEILQFLRYLRTQWMPLADLVSVSRESLASSDICETFHRQVIVKLCRPNRDHWSFFDRLNSLMQNTENLWRAPPLLVRSRTQVREDARISRIQDRLSGARLGIAEFLLGIMDHRRRTQISVIVLNGVEHFDVINELPLERNDFIHNAPVAVDGNAIRIVNGINMLPVEANEAEGEVINDEEADDDFVFDHRLGMPDFHNFELIVDDDPNNEPVAERQPNDEPVAERLPNDEPIAERQQNDEPVAERQPNDEPIAERQQNDEPVAEIQPDGELQADDGPVRFIQRPCSACLEIRPCMVYNPCGHLTICANCDLLLVTRSCPICRQHIVSTTKVFYV